MTFQVVDKGATYILNYCAKYLARTNTDPRHNYSDQFAPDDVRALTAECWRFPIIDTYHDDSDPTGSYWLNIVTFVYDSLQSPTPPTEVGVVGTFAPLYLAVPLQRVNFAGEPTRYWSVSILVPKGQIHRYKFLVDGKVITDPINPQRVTEDNGMISSRFFTDMCTHPLSFEHWEGTLLTRLTDHILPFDTASGRTFLQQFYNNLDRVTPAIQGVYAYRLDEPIGIVNYIDNVLAREEHHHLPDYKTCLDIIDKLLRRRNPFQEPADMPKNMFVELYDQLASNNVPGWDYTRYNSPRYFLQLLRRHAWTGAFSHPKYGGNIGGAGWAYLEETFRDHNNASTFNWRRAIEAPLGHNTDYHG